MILNHEFTVEGDLETVWRALLDLPRVAGCLPGATISPSANGRDYEGSMKIRVGPMTVAYQGTACLVDVSDADHRAVISLRAREAKGQGTALATITNHVSAEGSLVRVRAETDLQITGPQARFGRGVMEEVGNRVLGEFAQRLQAELAADAGAGAAAGAAGAWVGEAGGTEGVGGAGATGAGGAAGGAGAGPAPLPPVDDAFDMGAAIAQTAAARGARRAIPVLLAAVVLLVLWRRRR